MDPITIALLASTALSTGASFLGSSAQSKAAQQGLNFQKQVYGQQQADLSPFKQAGTGALGMISDLYGLNGGGGFGASAMNQFRNSPDYAWNFGEGLRALQNNAAAHGSLFSGNFARAASDYGQNTANNYLNQYTNRLMGVAGMGQQAALGGGQLASGMAGQIGQSFGNQGAANASGFIGGANALTGGIGSGMNNYMLSNYLNRSSFSPNQGIGGGGGFYGGSPASNANLMPMGG